MSSPTLRANSSVIGRRAIPSLEFQFIFVNVRISLARSAHHPVLHSQSPGVQEYACLDIHSTTARIRL